jgi:hypothetical protein
MNSVNPRTRKIVSELVEFALSRDPPEPYDPDKGPSHRGVYHQILTSHGYEKDRGDPDHSVFFRTNVHPRKAGSEEFHVVVLQHPNNSKLVGSWEHTASTGGGNVGRSASYFHSYLSKIHKD